jgi:hypothetical protein
MVSQQNPGPGRRESREISTSSKKLYSFTPRSYLRNGPQDAALSPQNPDPRPTLPKNSIFHSPIFITTRRGLAIVLRYCREWRLRLKIDLP